MNDRIQELAAEILRLRGEPAREDEHFAFAFLRHLFLSQMERAEKAEAALAEAEAEIKTLDAMLTRQTARIVERWR